MERTKYPGIYRRGDRYVAVVSYKGGTKKRQKWITASTLAEVQRKRREFLTDLDKGLKPTGGKMTLEAFLLDEWLPEVRATKRPLTARSYTSSVTQHIVPRIGGVRLQDVDREVLSPFYRSLSQANARNAHIALSSAFSWAVRERGWLAVNPCASVRPPKYERTEARHLDVDESRRMLSAVSGSRLEPAIILGLVGGLRIAEVSAVRWADIDLDRGAVTVRASWWGKTKSGRIRGLTLPAPQVEALRRWKVRQAEELLALGIRQDDETYVVTDPAGQEANPNHIAHSFANFCREYGFDITFHGLRHSAAIMMLTSGVDPKTAASRLGHANPGLLLNVYAHHVQSADQAAAKRLEALLEAEG